MVVLNICKKIKPLCISKKLGLYISNLDDCPYGDWREYINEQYINAYKIAKITSEKFEHSFIKSAYEHYKKHYPLIAQNYSSFDEAMIGDIVSNLVCIYLDYDYEDMPMGGWDENPFDGRLCEKDYTELIIDFLNFLSDGGDRTHWIYSSNYDEPTPFHRLAWVNSDSDSKIDYLKNWGQKIDCFLEERNDYLELDYLIRSIHDERDCDAYQLSKLYSLCQLFLEKENESELDQKLPQFIDSDYDIEERREIAKLLRQMRNKVAHGDFIAFEKKAEEFAKKFMDGRYNFDYSEYSRKNWVLLNVYCLLSSAVKVMINKLFDDKSYMVTLKKQDSYKTQ